MNGTAGAHGGEDYQQWMEGKVAQGKASPQTQRHGGEVYSNTLPVRKVAPAKNKTTLSKDTYCARMSNCALNVSTLSRDEGRMKEAQVPETFNKSIFVVRQRMLLKTFNNWILQNFHSYNCIIILTMNQMTL